MGYEAIFQGCTEEQVNITSMYLTGDAKLWWRTRLDDDASVE